MARNKPPLGEDWLIFKSADPETDGLRVLIHAEDIYAFHEGHDGVCVIEFDPMLDRRPKRVYTSFSVFVDKYVGAWDARGRKPRKRKGPAAAGPKIVRLNDKRSKAPSDPPGAA